jgi:hypothetical protein
VKRLLGTAVLAAALGAVAVALVLTTGASGGQGKHDPLLAAAEGQLQPAHLDSKTSSGQTVSRTMPFFSAALIDAELAACAARGVSGCDERVEGSDAGTGGDVGAPPDLGQTPGTLGCSQRDRGGGDEDRGGGNVRVNQDCTFRRQAEEDITYNPLDPSNLVAGQNDSRVGFNQCGIDWSTDNGAHWGDLLPPFRQKLNEPQNQVAGVGGDPNNNTIFGDPGTEHTYDFASDPAPAVDGKGRAYFSCVVLDIFSNAAGLFVTQSPAYAKGAFYYNWTFRRFTVAEDNNPLVTHDKNMTSADRYASSPNDGNAYVTWTVFNFDAAGNYKSSPIFGSMSTDGGFTWSTPQEISGTSDTLCFFGDFFDPTRSPHSCDFDQGSYSVALPNGDLQVIFNNGNTPAGNPNGQQLGVHCKPTGSSTNGTANLNCAAPAKVGDDIVTGEPQCNFGRGPEECVPGPFIRTNDFPRITKDNTQDNHVYAVWQDYRNGEYDIQMSISLDGGLTWHEAGTVNPDTGLDHYMPATDQSPSHDDRVGVSYFRSERVPGENTTPAGGFAPGVNPGVQQGNSDYALAGGTGAQTPYDFKVVSPSFPPPNGNQAGFNGDYSGLTINKGEEAHPIWSDTRNVDPDPVNGNRNDEDVFTDQVGLPNGNAHRRAGEIGRR